MKKTLGTFEKVSFPEFGMDDIMAKVDTGAFTGALHCTKVKELEEDGVKVLRFSPFDHPKTSYRTDNFERGIIKSSNGSTEQRYFIETSIMVRGKRYAITLSLADRSEMKWPVLIGRRFLHTNEFIVDVSEARK